MKDDTLLDIAKSNLASAKLLYKYKTAIEQKHAEDSK